MKRVLGYVAPWSLAPGERLTAHVGLRDAGRYESRAVRVFCADSSAAGPGLDLRYVPSGADGARSGRPQTNRVGSYAAARLINADFRRGLTFACFLRPSLVGTARQTIFSLSGSTVAYALDLHIDGELSFEVRTGEVCSACRTAPVLQAKRWHVVYGVHDAAAGLMRVGAHCLDPAPFTPPAASAESSVPAGMECAAENVGVLFAAVLDGGVPRAGYNGKIEAPVLLAHARDEAWLQGWTRSYLAGDAGDGPVDGWTWDFALRPSAPPDALDRLDERGGAHALTVNLPSRGAKGVRWTGEWHDWRQCPAQYGAVAFHDDDLEHAGWMPDFTFDIPRDWPSGVYALELTAAGDTSLIPFFVRPPRGRATAPAAFLASTFTSIAYGNYRFHMRRPEEEAMIGGVLLLSPADVYLLENGDTGQSLYDTHPDGTGVRFASRHRPILNMGTASDVWNLSEDTHLLAWLERSGGTVDVITDEDLHEEGAALLARYRVLITGSHPEYLTTPMWDAIRAYLAGGGRIMALGGNGFYWRIAVHPARPGVIELRRAEGGARFWAEEPGEYYHALTGEYGGLWARVGRSPQALVGVGTRAIGFRVSGWYERTAASHDPRAAFIFAGLGEAERIGDFGLLGGGAAGWEIDAADFTQGTPLHALVVASSHGLSDSVLPVPEAQLMPFPGQHGASNPEVRADMVFFETGAGGAVFATGSMAWLASLPCHDYDNNVARITGNVLARFLQEDGFEAGPGPDLSGPNPSGDVPAAGSA